MTDGGPGGPHRDLWALPSEPLDRGAAEFLAMAHDLQQLMSDAASGEPDAAALVALRRDPGTPGTPARGAQERPDVGPESLPGDEEGASSLTGPHLRLVDDVPGDGAAPAGPDRQRSHNPEEADEGARLFLDMVDRADAVRVLPVDPGGDGGLDWLWASSAQGAPAADALLGAVEEAMRHVSQSEEIRSEEMRARLLDLFTDFAARQPWKETERPESQRMNRLSDRARTERSGEGP